MASVTNLTNQRIADSYVQLIHTGDDGGLGSSALTLYDGDGTASGLKLSTGGIELEDSKTIKLGTGTDLQIYHDGSNSFITNSTGTLKIATETSGIAVTIGHTTSETTIADNLTVTGNASVGGNLVVTGTTTFNGGTLTLGDANTDNIVFGGEVDSNIIPDDDNTYDLGSSSKEWKDLYVDGVAYVDAINFNGTAISSTATELNILDGDTSASSTTIADADRVVVNDNGTMKQVAVTDLSAYFDDEITAMPNLVSTGALNSGSITSGFGAINNGSSAITTTGLISGGSLDIDDVLINGSTIGHTDDTDLITVADGIATVAGEISVTTLDIGGTNVTSTASELNILDGVTSTTAELNYNDTGSAPGTVVASKTVTVDANKDVASFRNITLTGELDAGSLDVSGDADIDGTLEADAITVNGSSLSSVIAGTTVSNATLSATTTVSDSTANTNFPVIFHDESNALLDDTGALRYNPSSGTLLVPNLSVSGTTTTVDTVTMEASNAIIFEGATADAHESTLTIIDPTADRTINLPNQSGTLPVLAVASTTQISSTPEELNILDGATVVVGEINALDLGATAVGTAIASKAVILDSNKDYTGIRNFTITGELDAGSLDISGDADIDGTLETDALTIGGVTLAETISDTTGAMFSSNTETGITATYEDGDNTIDLAINASQTTITSITNTSLVIGRDADNDIDFATDNNIIFRASGTDQIKLQDGALLPVTDNDIDLGSDSLQFKDAHINGTLEADAITIAGVTLAETISDTTGAMFSSNTETGITATYQDADNTIDLEIDASMTSITSLVNSSLEIGRDADNRIKFGTDNQIIFEVDGGDNVIFKTSGEIEASSLDISGDVDVDGTLEADAVTIDGVALGTFVRDTVGTNMVSSNTESGITVTYDTSNDNIDFSINASQTTITSLLATDIVIGEDAETKIDFETANEIHFDANNAEKLVIDGTATTTYQPIHFSGSDAIVQIVFNDSTQPANVFSITSAEYSGAGGNPNIFKSLNSTIVQIISNTGGVELTSGATSFSAISSDERLKQNWNNFENATDKINTLTKIGEYQKKDPKTNDFPKSTNADGDEIVEDKKFYGLSANEVQKILPLSAIENKDGYLGLNYQDVFVLALKSIQELSARIKVLEDA